MKLTRFFTRAGSPREAADRLIALGNEAESRTAFDEACAAYRQAVAAAPGYAKAHLNLGIAEQASGRLDAALGSYENALKLDAADPYIQYNLANLLRARGELARAEELLARALASIPGFTDARVVLANVYDLQGNCAAAAAALEIALQQRPDYAGAWFNYGDALIKLGRRAEAERALRRACELDPAALPPLHLLGNLLRADAQIDEALRVFGAARQLAPARFDLESMELLALNLSENVSEEVLSARHRAFGARLEAAFPARFAPFRNDRDPDRVLRVGYISCDFNQHPVAWFALPVLERHDRAACRIYAYSTNPKQDDMTRQLEARSDMWLDAHTLSDWQLADRIHSDAIDILVDLTGHAGIMRLEVFAQQPAPVQVTWLGYLNTTGLKRVHYRLCDAHTDPPGLTESLHTETLVRLPHSQWCYRPIARIPHATEPPCTRNGFVTFGSFNHAPKLSAAVRTLWIEILARLPDARLLIVGVPEGRARDRLLQDFAAGAISRSRLTIVPRVSLDEYFDRFNAVDIALDSTPYSGGTTTCDTLWMGVPVVTVPGARSVSRSAASILATVGLSSWIAQSPQDYVQLAARFGADRVLLAELRRSLRQRLQASPLMDEQGFVRDLESAYRRMWQSWCSGVAM